MNALALSVRQPWANLIVWGLKSVEIRSWTTRYRGSLLIHASKSLDQDGLRRFRIGIPTTSALVGAVDLESIEPLTPANWDRLASEHLDLGAFQEGLYAWHLTNQILFQEPIPCRGDRKLFRVELCSKVLEQTSDELRSVRRESPHAFKEYHLGVIAE